MLSDRVRPASAHYSGFPKLYRRSKRGQRDILRHRFRTLALLSWKDPCGSSVQPRGVHGNKHPVSGKFHFLRCSFSVTSNRDSLLFHLIQCTQRFYYVTYSLLVLEINMNENPFSYFIQSSQAGKGVNRHILTEIINSWSYKKSENIGTDIQAALLLHSYQV